MQRNTSIDLIKVVGMFMIMLLHNWSEKGASGLAYASITEFYLIGAIAVPLFFMVSGYLLSNREPDCRYSIRKILHILRFVLCICIPFDIFRLCAFGNHTLSFPNCLIQKGAFSIFWYMGASMIIYALLPALLRAMRSRKGERILFGIVFSISTLAFISGELYHWEDQYIWISIRIWYWIMYFILGAWIRRNEAVLTEKISFLYVIVAYLSLILLNRFTHADGVSFFYGSIPCIAYAASMFIWVLSLKCRPNRAIEYLATLFLPVYAFHGLIFSKLFKLELVFSLESLPTLPAMLVEYAISTMAVLAVCMVLMQIPYLNKIFKL